MPTPQSDAKPSIITISSHVARGAVGNRAIVFALERLGFPVWSVPTVMLPWHPGHGPATRIIPAGDKFSAFLDDLANAPWIGEVGGILSGYLGAPDQAASIARLIRSVRERNPGVAYVCDPVIGDNGGLYVEEPTARSVRDVLAPMADVVTPNRFELEWLTESSNKNMITSARALGRNTVLTTSAFTGVSTGNVLVSPDGAFTVRHEAVADPPNGPGDLTAALYLSHILSGKDEQTALHCATCSVFALLKRSKCRGADELTLAADADCLTDPPLDLAVSAYETSDE